MQHALNELVRAHSQRLAISSRARLTSSFSLVLPAGEYAHKVLPNHFVWRNAWLATKECMHPDKLSDRSQNANHEVINL